MKTEQTAGVFELSLMALMKRKVNEDRVNSGSNSDLLKEGRNFSMKAE